MYKGNVSNNLAVGFLFFLFFCFSGCETTSSQTPVTSTVSRGSTVKAARIVQGADRGRMTGLGKGSSMAPIYSENTILVINPITFDELKAGMIVAYRSSSGKQVVHRLEFLDHDEWVAAGINNPTMDTERVTRENLLGIVYGVFYGDSGDSQK